MLSIFAFEGNQVRFVGTWDKPEWVAADVVAALYPDAARSNYANLLGIVPAKYKGIKPIITPGGTQSMITLLEGGFYHLISRSNSPIAEAFRDWVYEDVLPSIRKTGGYGHRDDLRLSAVEIRKEAMAALHSAGFTESRHFINVTNAAYMGLFGMSAKKLREERGLPPTANVRDHLTMYEKTVLRSIEWVLMETLAKQAFGSSSEVNRYIRNIADKARVMMEASQEFPRIGADSADR